jgi:hypothetical protein
MNVSKTDGYVPEAIVVDASQVYTAEPSAPTAAVNVPPPLPQFENEGGAREFLSANHFPQGLQDAFIESLTKTPLRYFIIDDSGSMGTNDGKRVVQHNGKKRYCS